MARRYVEYGYEWVESRIPGENPVLRVDATPTRGESGAGGVRSERDPFEVYTWWFEKTGENELELRSRETGRDGTGIDDIPPMASIVIGACLEAMVDDEMEQLPVIKWGEKVLRMGCELDDGGE